MLLILKLKAKTMRKCVVALQDHDGEVVYRIAYKTPFNTLICNRFPHRTVELQPDGTVVGISYVIRWKMVVDYRKGGK